MINIWVQIKFIKYCMSWVESLISFPNGESKPILTSYLSKL